MKKITAALLIAAACALAGSTTVNAEEASVLSAPMIPNWATWECDKAHVSHKIIETYECHGPEENPTSRIILKAKGAEKPFLIGWGYDEKAPDAGRNTYAALYKDGKWIVGARGTGFTTKETSDCITFFSAGANRRKNPRGSERRGACRANHSGVTLRKITRVTEDAIYYDPLFTQDFPNSRHTGRGAYRDHSSR
jgi:hypothetical protein